MSATNALRLTVSAALLAWIGWRTDWSSVGRAFLALRVEYWLAALGLLLAAQVVSALRWRMFARILGFGDGLVRMTGLYFIGMFFNLVLPTSVGGGLARVWYLDGGRGRRWAALASVFLDRLNGLLVLVAMACLAVLLAPRDVPRWVRLSVWSITAAAALGAALLPLALRWRVLPERRRHQLVHIVGLVHAPRTLLGASLLSALVQTSSVGIVWLIGVGLGAPVPPGYYWILAPMVSLLTLLPVSVNGMGVREGGVVLFLAPLGVDPATAVTLAFLWFLVYVAGGLCGGVVYLAGAFPAPPAVAGQSGTEEASDGSVIGNSDQGRTRQLGQAA
ncbi:MAG: flippase-like domain-containing protein [Gemmataceae bacterium]|nr:flippase-like domain-containing protein [Gemmataceae bacterium]